MRLIYSSSVQKMVLVLLFCAAHIELYAQQGTGRKPFLAPSPHVNQQRQHPSAPTQAQAFLEKQYVSQSPNPVQLGVPLHDSAPAQPANWNRGIAERLPPLYAHDRPTSRNSATQIRQVQSSETVYGPDLISEDPVYSTMETMPESVETYTESIEQLCQENCWGWTVLPTDLLYKSYLAGPKESRMAMGVLHEKDIGWQLELEAGARVGILRYGSLNDDVLEGWQLDLEGAGPPRLNMEEELDLEAADFRVGVPLTWRRGAYQAKFAYYHTSAHAGDEYLRRNPSFQRINYVRDVFVLGGGYFPDPDLRLYAEIGYAFNTDGGAEPWELQFGAEFSPVEHNGFQGAPFWAVNGYLREEVNWGGNVCMMVGWQWRGDRNNHLFRIGLQYIDGKTIQYQFYNNSEQMIGFGTWYDF
ncbi:hypothetical protein Pan153_57490 [Gimesia panareensis]|uniref:DUF1207 domain-containing protein n=1 Tax=Gimesia panareensis TaxID=2527978 RepID=A0A518FXF9_9PLAN|nr:DUF1207 domain-containing protein [Gimesia panareensis]QDV21067.1 hypothetical protein Pan153_57490 [Gimesia panareensis]